MNCLILTFINTQLTQLQLLLLMVLSQQKPRPVPVNVFSIVPKAGTRLSADGTSDDCVVALQLMKVHSRAA